jgi:hypothetical protein
MIISFVGDISLHGLNPEKIELDSSIINVFRGSDLIVGNLENPITTSIAKADQFFVHLKANEKAFNLLKYFDVLNLCNNHIFDFGAKGFNDTIKFLKTHKIKYFGAGKTIDEAQNPLKLFINEKGKFAFIGGILIPGPKWPKATKERPGTSNCKAYRKTIKKLKEQNFFIVYYAHWGYEYIKTPPPSVRKHAKKMIGYGVDLIVGTHPHVLQGYEKYKGKYIFYSLGNFIFSDSEIQVLATPDNYEKCKTTALLQVGINDQSDYNISLLPVEFSDQRICLSSGVKKDAIIKEIEEMSKIFYKPYFKYIKSYYSQTPEMLKQNARIRSRFPKDARQSLLRKIFSLKNITLQGLLNRIAYRVFIK